MARNITVIFADGSKHVYQNAPDNLTPDQVKARATHDFGKTVVRLDGGRGTVAGETSAPVAHTLAEGQQKPVDDFNAVRARHQARNAALFKQDGPFLGVLKAATNIPGDILSEGAAAINIPFERLSNYYSDLASARGSHNPSKIHLLPKKPGMPQQYEFVSNEGWLPTDIRRNVAGDVMPSGIRTVMPGDKVIYGMEFPKGGGLGQIILADNNTQIPADRDRGAKVLQVGMGAVGVIPEGTFAKALSITGKASTAARDAYEVASMNPRTLAAVRIAREIRASTKALSDVKAVRASSPLVKAAGVVSKVSQDTAPGRVASEGVKKGAGVARSSVAHPTDAAGRIEAAVQNGRRLAPVGQMAADSVLARGRVADSVRPGLARGALPRGTVDAGGMKASGMTPSTPYGRALAVGKALNPDPVTEAVQALSAALNKDGATVDQIADIVAKTRKSGAVSSSVLEDVSRLRRGGENTLKLLIEASENAARVPGKGLSASGAVDASGRTLSNAARAALIDGPASVTVRGAGRVGIARDAAEVTAAGPRVGAAHSRGPGWPPVKSAGRSTRLRDTVVGDTVGTVGETPRGSGVSSDGLRGAKGARAAARATNEKSVRIAFQRPSNALSELAEQDRIAASAADSVGASVTPPSNPTAYSVAFETKLDPIDFGKARGVHLNRANAAFDAALQSDADFARAMDDLIPGIQDSVSSVGGRATPDGWVWEHASTSTAFGHKGVMRLVPEAQHTPGSPWWRVLHPDPGAAGGYSEWAIPNGAPKN